jgi:hypothetical protein
MSLKIEITGGVMFVNDELVNPTRFNWKPSVDKTMVSAYNGEEVLFPPTVIAEISDGTGTYADWPALVTALTPLFPNTSADILVAQGYMTINEIGDDRGVVVNDKLEVGKPGAGNELVVGEGDSYPVQYAWQFDFADMTGNTIVNATDVSSQLGSEDSSAIGLFNGTTSGKVLLVGSEYPFGGIKAKINTAGTIEPANVIAEFLSFGTTWFNAPFMVTDANWPFDRKGENLASTSGFEQWRFGFDPEFLPSPWAAVTLNINGTDYTYRWALIRTTGNITSDPLIEQFKLHTNRWECNREGVTEYFGRARYPKTLKEGIKDVINNTSSSPVNENVQYASGVTAQYPDNEFANGAVDSFIITQNLVKGLDTSIPLLLDFSFYPKGSSGGDVEMVAEVINVEDGFVYDGNAATTDYTTVVTVSAGQNLTRNSGRIKIPINMLVDGGVVINLKRDASGGNPTDTLPHNIVITNVTLIGYFWKP